MGPFPVFNGHPHILLVVDYVSRWVEAIATKTNDARIVFGVPKALISDQGSHYCNRVMSSLLDKKSRKFCKRWQIPTRRTRADSLRMHFGYTGQHIRLHWGCLPTGLSSVKPVTYHLN
ncbi:hypothetical protein CR513_04441, partial [Mucuna pruriens]